MFLSKQYSFVVQLDMYLYKEVIHKTGSHINIKNYIKTKGSITSTNSSSSNLQSPNYRGIIVDPSFDLGTWLGHTTSQNHSNHCYTISLANDITIYVSQNSKQKQ